MAPQPGVTFPERRFIVTQYDEATGTETNIINSNPLPANYTTDQAIRPGFMDNAQQYLIDNPGVYFVYGPTNGGYWTDGDRVWDSRYNAL